MQDTSKMIGENGFVYVDNSITSETIYMIHVLEDSVFTVLKEQNKQSDTPNDVLTETNLTGKTVKAGAILTPYKEWFSDVTITSGSLICYRLGQ